MMNLEHLNMFVTVAKTGSFSACARQLGKVQSAVSQGIANLEIDLNVTLFDRSTRKPTLTPEGQHLLSFAEAILQQTQEMERAASALSRQEETQLTLVTDDGLEVDRLFSVIDEFAVQFPSTSLNVISAASCDIVGLISQGKANIGLMLSELTLNQDASVCYIGNMTFMAVVGVAHPLAKVGRIEPTDLIPHRQLVIQSGSDKIQPHFEQVSAQLWSASSFAMLMKYTERCLGWAYLPTHMAKAGIAAGKLHALPVTFDHKPWSVPVECVTPKRLKTGPAATWLRQALLTLLDEK